MNPEFDVVDLGTKYGGAIDEFLKRSARQIQPQRCVGYERPQAEKYRSIVERKKYNFRIADLATDEAIAALPTSEIYLLWHFLEHVPNKDWARKLVRESLTKAQHLVWFVLPSFQQDTENGEGVLRQHGMRFTWTFWHGHPTHWLVEDCTDSIKEWSKDMPSRECELIVKPATFINSMDNAFVVPIDTPVDVTEYKPKYGPKPLHIKFKQPIISAWEIIVKFK